jgi:integral membrane sensor domain MASE1
MKFVLQVVIVSAVMLAIIGGLLVFGFTDFTA